MKRKPYLPTLGFLAFFLLTAAKGTAQAALILLIFGNKIAHEDFHMSMDIGANINSLSSISGDPSVGANFGLGIHAKLSDQFYLVPEFKALSGKGLRNVKPLIAELPPEVEGSGINKQKNTLALNYLEIPVLLQYKVRDSRFYFSGGVQASFLTKAVHKTQLYYNNGSELEFRKDIQNGLNTFDLSIPVEVGYTIKPAINGKGMDLRLRYTHGFFNIFEETIPHQAYNSNFQIIATFPIIYQDR